MPSPLYVLAAAGIGALIAFLFIAAGAVLRALSALGDRLVAGLESAQPKQLAQHGQPCRCGHDIYDHNHMEAGRGVDLWMSCNAPDCSCSEFAGNVRPVGARS